MAIVLDGTNGITTNSGTVISASTIGVGGATPSTSGAGITFPATQSASTDANTLDDYEEGTWTPTYTSWGTSPSSAEAFYIKVGKLVYVEATLIGTNIAASSASSYVGGLPFTVSGPSNNNKGSGSFVDNLPSVSGSVLIYAGGQLWFATSFSGKNVICITAMYQTNN